MKNFDKVKLFEHSCRKNCKTAKHHSIMCNYFKVIDDALLKEGE